MHELDYYGDKFKWFVGVAKELSADGSKVKVRIYGIHRMDDIVDVSDGDLPEAIVLKPTTGGEGGTGQPIGIQNGDWVMGFFADGDDCMQPVVIGVIGGGTYSDATTSSVDGSDVDVGGSTIFNNDSQIPGDGIEHQGYNFLRARWEQIHGNPQQAHVQTCGMMGHIWVESRWRIGVRNAGEAAVGLCQWRQDRLSRLKKISQTPTPSLTQQLSFIFWEYNNTHKSAYRKMLAAQNVPEAVRAFSYFELHAGITKRGWNQAIADSRAHYQDRLGKALQYDRVFRNRYQAPGFENGPNRGVGQPGAGLPPIPTNDPYWNRGGGTTVIYGPR